MLCSLLSSRRMFSIGRLCSFQTPSEPPAQCYRVGLWGERGWGLFTQGRSTVACLSQLFHRSGKPSISPSAWLDMNSLSNLVWWKDVNILLIHSLTHRTTSNGRFPTEWRSSSESQLLTEAEQVGRQIEMTGGLMPREWGETLWTSVKRGLLYANSWRRILRDPDVDTGLWSVAEWI